MKRPQDIYFVVNSNRTVGFSGALSRGELAITQERGTTLAGKPVITDFTGISNDAELRFEAGRPDSAGTENGILQNISHNMMSFPFNLDGVTDYRAQLWDGKPLQGEIIQLGYKGTPQSEKYTIKLKKGEIENLTVTLWGEALGMLNIGEEQGYPQPSVTMQLTAGSEPCFRKDCETCDPCEQAPCAPIVKQLCDQFNNFVLPTGNGFATIADYPFTNGKRGLAYARPILNCPTTETTYEVKWFELRLCQENTPANLSIVQGQYPDAVVKVVSEDGAFVTYQLMIYAPIGGTVTAPVDYTNTTVSLTYDCACDAPAVETEGGYLYTLYLEDDGTDQSAVFSTLPNLVAGTEVLVGRNNQNSGQGIYSAILSAQLTNAEISAFAAAVPTVIIGESTQVQTSCRLETTVTEPWVEVLVCEYAARNFNITLPDTICGDDRLAELQAAYPDYTVSIETNYQVPNPAFDPLLPVDPVTNPETVPAATAGIACTTMYLLEGVPTNYVCEECDPVFKDYFKPVLAPAPYQGIAWEPVETGTEDEDVDCLCGIEIETNTFEWCADESLQDSWGSHRSYIHVHATGGYITNFDEAAPEGEKIHKERDPKYRQRGNVPTNYGSCFRKHETSSLNHFLGDFNYDMYDYQGRLLRDSVSLIDPCKHYIDYVVQVEDTQFARGNGKKTERVCNYHFIVEHGQQAVLEGELNKLAVAGGLKPLNTIATP